METALRDRGGESGMNAAEQFRDAIAAAGLRPPDELIADGKLHRFSTNGTRGDDAGWYALHLDGIPAGCFGDWRGGLHQAWRADIGCRLTAAEEAAHRARLIEIQREREAETARRHAAAARTAAALWFAAAPAEADHPYVTRKRVQPAATLRELPAERVAELIGYRPQAHGEPLAGRILIAPVRIGDSINTVEMIDEDGRKSALAGGTKVGGYWTAQKLPEGDGDGMTLVIGEGVATVLSGTEATGHPAVAALSSGNLLAVAQTMRRRYPAAALVIVADLLKTSGAADPHAIEAARAVGGRLAVPNFGADRPAEATDFNDLMMHRGLGAVGEAIMHARPVDADDVKTTETEWPEPLPLVAEIASEPYPMDALPECLRGAVEEVQGFVQAPVSLVATCALSAVSLAVQAYVDVKRADKLVGPSSLNSLNIAESGERKSTCDKFFTAAIEAYEKEQCEQFEPVIIQHKADLDAWTAKRNGLLDSIRTASKQQKSTAEYEQRLRELEAAKPKAPRVPKLLRGDDTPENLAWSLATSWPSAGVLSSEAGLIFGAHAMGRDSIMRNLALLNILWDGKTHDIGRRTSESFTLRGARFTVGLQVQEVTLRAFFDDSKGLARGMGFLARFLIAWPDSTQGYRLFSEPPQHWPKLEAFHRRLSDILKMPVPMDDTGVLTPTMLEFTPKAKDAWVEYHDEIEGKLGTGGELYDVRDVASKSADNAARVAANFQVFEHGVEAIGLDAFQGAARIAAWHLNESRRFFGVLALPTEVSDAARLDAWLTDYCRREGTHSVPESRVQTYGPSGLRAKAAIEAVLSELRALGRARLLGRGHARLIEVNPALLGTTATSARTATAGEYVGGAA